jgi:hypothetical protein
MVRSTRWFAIHELRRRCHANGAARALYFSDIVNLITLALSLAAAFTNPAKQ